MKKKCTNCGMEVDLDKTKKCTRCNSVVIDPKKCEECKGCSIYFKGKCS